MFTKPWKQPLAQLGQLVKGWGFDGIELPVRPGYQVQPEKIGQDLPKAVKLLADEGLKIFSIAGPTDEAALAACAEAGVPVIRIMAPIGEAGYLASERKYQAEFDALLPLLEKYGVKIVEAIDDYTDANFIGIDVPPLAQKNGIAIGKLQLPIPEKPQGQSLSWYQWANLVGKVQPTGRALQLFMDGVKPSIAIKMLVDAGDNVDEET